MSTNNQFATKIGLIAATVGSAVGLGSVWRFPAETQANGGAAYLVLYALCVLLLAVPVMLSEFALGREGRTDAIGVFKKLSPRKPWWIVGALAVLTPFLILFYYMVVAGWTLEYLWESVAGGLYAGLSENVEMSGFFGGKMQEYICTEVEPLVFTFIIIALNAVVLLGGVQKGIERLSNIMMPILFLIMLAMVVITLSLPNAIEGVKYFLMPDFSAITPRAVISALGQALFSLSVGMGVLITYANYYPSSTKLGRTSLIVAFSTMFIAVVMGLIIFPAVKSFGLDGENVRGATLVFVTLPQVFANLPCPQLWSSLFFILLFVAAFTSTVSIAEVPISMFIDRCGMSRTKAVAVVMLPLLFFSSLCSLSFSSMSSFTIFGYTFFDFVDRMTADVLLPIVSLSVCLYVGWFAPKGMLQRQLTNDGTLKGHFAKPVAGIIRYVAPVIIALIIIFTYV